MHDSDSASEEDRPKNRGWHFDYAPPPPQDQWQSDDEVCVLILVAHLFSKCVISLLKK